jgi:hypothetical protein
LDSRVVDLTMLYNPILVTVASLYMRRQILHHFSWASIRKVWVYMLSTEYGTKNDAKLTAVCIKALIFQWS